MNPKLRLPLPSFSANHINLLFNNEEVGWPLALCLSLVLHIIILLPSSIMRNRPLLDPGKFIEVKLVTPQQTSPKPAKIAQSPLKPKIKRKVKTKINKKPAAIKKQKITAKESPLARRKSIPKKKPAPTTSKLTEIKERLARQQEEEKLNAIRQRLRQEASPEAKALQTSLTKIYRNQLKAWLMRNWHLPEHLINSGLVATISLTIDAQGRLVKQTEEKLSDNPIFNHAMRQAIINASPFPAFPEKLNLPQEEFVITFDPNNLKQ